MKSVMIITARYTARCPNCNLAIDVGARIEWARGTKARHVVCPGDELIDFGEQDSGDLERWDGADEPENRVRNLAEVTARNAFKQLEKVLATTTLETERGTRYRASASEFMFMHHDANGYAFKHCETRNYLFLKGNELHIPKTSQPFMRGTFGSLNPPRW